MGNSLDKFGGYDDFSESNSSETKNRRKRRRSAEETSSDDDSSNLKTIKLDTGKYLYEKCFLNGENSDVSINALGKIWNLHKLNLKQCKFFEALLDGSWKDSGEPVLNLEIPDEKVTVEGLNTIFGSLYDNEIEINLEQIEGILAASSLVDLPCMLCRCAEEMEEQLSPENVTYFINLAETYGLKSVRSAGLVHLKYNFWRIMKNRRLLKDLTRQTLISLLSSSDVLLVEGEFDIYVMVKTWLVLQMCPETESLEDEEFEKKTVEILKDAIPGQLFLEYEDVFRCIKLHHLVLTLSSMETLDKDRLLPREILTVLQVEVWRTALENEENPHGVVTITEDDFSLNCIRQGRIVDASPKCWRWTGYNNGVDIILNYSRGMLTMKRNCFGQSTPYAVNLSTERTVHYRLFITDCKGKLLFGGMERHTVSLRLDQTIMIARLDDPDLLPISVHISYLAATSPPPALLVVNRFVHSREQQTI